MPAQVSAFIDAHPHFGVDPICRALDARPGNHYERKSRQPSKRSLQDEALMAEIKRVWESNRCIYGVRKVWRQLKREGFIVARCTVARLMRNLGIEGARRGKKFKTTKSDPSTPRPADLVNPNFVAIWPNRLWVTDFERHEALLNRVEMKGLHLHAVAAA